MSSVLGLFDQPEVAEIFRPPLLGSGTAGGRPGMDGIGALAEGRRFDGRIVRSVDVPCLEALGSMAGLAAARLRLLAADEAPPEPPPRRPSGFAGTHRPSFSLPAVRFSFPSRL